MDVCHGHAFSISETNAMISCSKVIIIRKFVELKDHMGITKSIYVYLGYKLELSNPSTLRVELSTHSNESDR